MPLPVRVCQNAQRNKKMYGNECAAREKFIKSASNTAQISELGSKETWPIGNWIVASWSRNQRIQFETNIELCVDCGCCEYVSLMSNNIQSIVYL